MSHDRCRRIYNLCYGYVHIFGNSSYCVLHLLIIKLRSQHFELLTCPSTTKYSWWDRNKNVSCWKCSFRLIFDQVQFLHTRSRNYFWKSTFWLGLQIDEYPCIFSRQISLVLLKGQHFAGTEVFSVPLVLKSKDEGVKENNILARGLGGCRTNSAFTLSTFPFTCSIQFVSPVPSINIKDVFLTKPRFDIVTGECNTESSRDLRSKPDLSCVFILTGFYYCDIIPIGEPTLTTSTLETRVQVNAQSKDIEGNPLEVAHLPPIYVSEKEVVFYPTTGQLTPVATLKIHGLPSVLRQVKVSCTMATPTPIPTDVAEH